MSKISVADALSFADLLKTSAETAQAAGETEFDLTAAAESKYQSALDSLEAAIAAKKAQQSGS